MTWSTKYFSVLALWGIALAAHGARIQFHGEGVQGDLKAYPVARNAGVGGVDLRFSLSGVDIDSTNDGFSEIRVRGLTPFNIPGNPALFSTGELLAVPNGFEPELEVVSIEERRIPGVLVRPAQRKFRCSGPREESFSFNSALYESQSVYPASPVFLEEAGNIQGIRLVRIGVTPLRMDMGNEELVATVNLTARVHLREIRRASIQSVSPSVYQLLRAVTVNGKTIPANLLRASTREQMVIVVADALKASIAPFVAWKQSKGIDVVVYTASEAGSTKEKIKAHLQSHYDAAANKPSFFLFVGNKTSLPAYYESTSAGQAISDYRYTLLSGADDLPDVFYGRLIADDATDVEKQVRRWVQYEKQVEKAGTWYHNGVTIASNEGSDPSDSEYAEMVENALKAGTYQAFGSFRQGDGNATAANISAALEQGASWIAYFGHGSGTSWGSTNGSFSNTTVAALKNAQKLPVLIDVACMNASWASLPLPFGKAWVTHMSDNQDAGAVAFYGGSVNISWDPPAVMSVGIAKYHFEKPVHSLGGSTMAGQIYLREEMGTGKDTLENLHWYNLFGDPSMLIRTAVPKAYQVKYSVTRVGPDASVVVTAIDLNGQGVAGLQTALTKSTGQAYAVGVTDTNGQAKLKVTGLSGLEPNTLLTLSGYNAETTQVLIP